MSQFNSQITPDVLAACQAKADKIAAALGQAFDAPFDVRAGEPAKLNTTALPDGFEAPGLVLLLHSGDEAALLVLSEASQLTPDWCAEPDDDGQQKLDTLLAELAKLLLPAEIVVDQQATGWVADISAAITRGEVETGAELLPLSVMSDETHGVMHMVWPATNPQAVFSPTEAEPAAVESPAKRSPQSAPADEFARLPSYTRSMLRIEVPLVVKLASTRQTIDEILELGPGAIIKFDKSCEELLDLEIGGHAIAQGEAVKVGDKFGLRINSMVLPSERFHGLRGEK
jgi:flagellar motor switch protein FliN